MKRDNGQASRVAAFFPIKLMNVAYAESTGAFCINSREKAKSGLELVHSCFTYR